MLKVKNVSKCFKDKLIINDISFEIQKGEIVSLLGANGSGKTTTIKLLCNLLEKDKGEITYDDEPIQNNDISYLPEERCLYYDCTVYQQLFLLCSLANIKDVELVIDYYLDDFKLIDKKDTLICELSKGNQQKVAFISTLIKNAPIILLDEPFTGLDLENIKLFEKKIVSNTNKERIMIISSHIYEPINQYSDRFIVIDKGTVKINITKDELENNEKRILIIKNNIDIKGYLYSIKDNNTTKYIFPNEIEAARVLRFLNKNNICDFTYRKIQIEDVIENEGIIKI